MKKTLKSQLIVAITMTLIATVALTSATYAWFTQIANPEVNKIELYVKAGDTLMLSAYDNATTPDINTVADWKAAISQTDIQDPAYTVGKWGAQTTAVPANMFNVSTLFNATNSNFGIAIHNALGNTITGYSAATAGTDYSKFSLWVKSTKAGTLKLNTDSIVQAIDGYLGANLIAADAPRYNIRDTVRVGFVPVNAGVENWAGAVVWEPNSTEHLATVYGGPGTAVKIPTDAAVKTIGNVDPLATPAVTLADLQGAQTTQDFGANISLFNIAAPETAYNFNVYIWVEGSDADTVNAVAKNYFSTYLKFVQP